MNTTKQGWLSLLTALVMLTGCVEADDAELTGGSGGGTTSSSAGAGGQEQGAGGSGGDAGGDVGAGGDGGAGGMGAAGGAGGMGAGGAGGGDTTWATVPMATGMIITVSTESALEQACANASPGDQIRIAAGTYSDTFLDFDGHGGTPGVDDPIVLIPADAMNPPVFEGANAIRDADNVWMFAFETQQVGLSGTQRSWNIQNADGLELYYWDLAQTEFIALESSNNVTHLDIDHLYGHGNAQTGGRSFLKMGVTGVAADQRYNRIRKSYLRDLRGHRETISGKEGYLTIEDLHLDNSYDVASRLAFHMTIRRVRASRHIALSAGGHLVVDSIAGGDILLNTGNEDAGALAADYSDYIDNGSQTYYSAHDCEVYNSTAGGVIRAGDSTFNYQADNFTATATQQGGNSPNMTTGFGATFTTVTPPPSTGTPPIYTVDDVGPAAYRTYASPPTP